ncbi:MAG TPA: YciI family protein [Xanthobacteraceae bacterium]|nr:YciI family protein [Xanthobacteraceae bacterium]
MARMTAKELTEMSMKHGMLAKQLYVVFTTPTNGLDPVLENIQDHLAYQIDLERRGIMFAAGPNWTDDGENWEGDGMVVIRAASLAEAREIAAQDPMHARGARSFRVRPWMINEGTVRVRLDYSTGRFHLE